MDRNLTHCLTIIHSSDGGIPGLAAGSEDAILISSIGGHISNALGNIGGIACGAGAGNGNRHRGVGGNILALHTIGHMVKLIGSNRRGNNDEAVGDGTLRTVGGGIRDLELIEALRLAAIGHGSTAVQVTGPNTAQVQHDLCLLLNRQTHRCGCLTAVRGHDDQLIVGSNADGLTGILRLCIQTGADLAICDQHGINTDRLLDIALILFVIAMIGNLHCTILQDSKIAGTCGFRSNNTVHHEDTGGLTGGHVVVGGIDTCYNGTLIVSIACRSLVIKSSDLLSEFGHTKVSGIHVLIRRKRLNGIHIHVCGSHKHLDLIAVFVINSVLVLGDTGSEGGFLIAHDVKVGNFKSCLGHCRRCRLQRCRTDH